MQSIIHDGATAVTSRPVETVDAPLLSAAGSGAVPPSLPAVAVAADDEHPYKREHEIAIKVISRIKYAAASRLNCLDIVEAHILSGLGHLVPGLLRAVEAHQLFAEDAADQYDPAFVLQHNTAGRLKIVSTSTGRFIGREYTDAERGAAFERRDLLNASHHMAVTA